MSRAALCLPLLPALASAAVAVGPPLPAPRAAVVFSGPALGARYTVRVVMAPGDVRARERVRAAIDRELALVDRLFSDRDPGSEVSRLNARGSAEPFPVSADTVAVLELARRASELTGGAFDVTAAPLAAALLVLGPDAGRALAAREGLAARLVLRQPDGSYAEWPTPAFEGRLAPPR